MNGKLELADDTLLMQVSDLGPPLGERLLTYVNALYEAQHEKADEWSERVDGVVAKVVLDNEWEAAYELEEELQSLMAELAPAGYRWNIGYVMNEEGSCMGWFRVGATSLDTQQAAYLESGGGNCPFCGSHAITGDSVTIEGGTAGQEVTCDECDRSWLDEYVLTGFTPAGD